LLVFESSEEAGLLQILADLQEILFRACLSDIVTDLSQILLLLLAFLY